MFVVVDRVGRSAGNMGDAWCKDNERMILLEAFVGYLSIRSDAVEPSLVNRSQDTCVVVEFLHYPPLVICENDFLGFPADREDPDNIYFGSGKSCLFSLAVPRERPLIPVPFLIKVSAIRKETKGELAGKIVVGEATVDMSDSFHELRSLNLDENCDKLPLIKATVGVYDLKDESGSDVGSVMVLFRLSCFGKLMITQFSLGKKDENFFKGADAKEICEATKCREPELPESKTTPNESVGKRISVCGHNPLQNNLSLLGNKCLESSLISAANKCQSDYWKCLCRSTPYSPQPPGPECPEDRSAYSGSENKKTDTMGMRLAPGEVGIRNDRVVFQLPMKSAETRREEVGQKEGPGIHYKITTVEYTPEGLKRNTVYMNSNELPKVTAHGGSSLDGDYGAYYIRLFGKSDGEKGKNVEFEMRAPKMRDPKPATATRETQFLESDIVEEVQELANNDEKARKGSKGGKGGKDKGKKGKGKKK